MRKYKFIFVVVIGNVAYAKSTRQSAGDVSYPSGRAVDGDTNPHMGAGHCALASISGGRNAWWMVDLNDTYNISRVIIYNTDSEGKYIHSVYGQWYDSHHESIYVKYIIKEMCCLCGIVMRRFIKVCYCYYYYYE